jgi:F-type H+-transporting ATPase subunit b
VRRAAPFVAAGLTFLSSAAFAAEAKEGMPQLDFGNQLTISQVVWLVIIFFVLYQLLSRWALPQVAEVLEARAASIGRDLEAARTAKAGSDAAIAALTEATQKAHAEAQAEIARAVAAAKESAAAQSAELNARLDAQLSDAERSIAAARNAAMGALRQVATTTASEVVSRLTGRPASATVVDVAVGDALTARGLG